MQNDAMKRYIILLYSAVAYLAFLGVSIWMAAFLLDVNAIRSGAAAQSWLAAVLIDIALVSLFAITHSVMARPWFKRLLVKVVAPSAERATYVLQSSVFLAVVFLYWQPIPVTVWQADGVLEGIVLAIFCTGLGGIMLATVLLGHFEFTGLQQAWDNLVHAEARQQTFRTPSLYRFVRHPLQLGIVLTMFSVPHMTADGLLFAVTMLGYIVVGLKFEERGLLREFGSEYERYQKTVPMLFPRLFFLPRRHGPRPTAGK